MDTDLKNILNSTKLPDILSGYRGSLIVYLVTDDFAANLRVALASLNLSFKQHPTVLVMTVSETYDALASVAKKYNVILWPVKFDETLCGPIMGHLSKGTDSRVFYARLLLWSKLFQQFDNILFIDADTIVLENLEELLQKKSFYIEQDAYQGFNDVVDTKNLAVMSMLKKDEIVLEKSANAGVFLLTRNSRTPELGRSILALLQNYKDNLIWADQTLLNLWMFKNGFHSSLANIYNYQTRSLMRDKIYKYRHVKILHLNGMWGNARKNLMFLTFILIKLRVPKVLILFVLKCLIKIFALDPDKK